MNIVCCVWGRGCGHTVSSLVYTKLSDNDKSNKIVILSLIVVIIIKLMKVMKIIINEGSDLGHDDLLIWGRNAAFCLAIYHQGVSQGSQLPSRTRHCSLRSTNHHVQGLSLHHQFLSSFQLYDEIAEGIGVGRRQRFDAQNSLLNWLKFMIAVGPGLWFILCPLFATSGKLIVVHFNVFEVLLH